MITNGTLGALLAFVARHRFQMPTIGLYRYCEIIGEGDENVFLFHFRF